MFGWLRRMFDAAYGAVDNTVRSWVTDLVTGVYGFLHMIFGDVGTAWDILQDASLNLWHGLDKFARHTFATLYAILRIVVPAVIRDYTGRFNTTNKYVRDVYDYAVRQVKYLIHLISESIDSLWQIVLRDVYRPLLAFITEAWKWITHEGALVYFYITHADKLIDLVWTALLSKLEREAWNAGALLGKFFLALILRNVKRFALLIEDILDAVL